MVDKEGHFVPSLKLITHRVEGKNNTSCQSVRDFYLMFAYPGCSLINLIPFLIAYSNSLLLPCPQPVLNIIGLVQKLLLTTSTVIDNWKLSFASVPTGHFLYHQNSMKKY